MFYCFNLNDQGRCSTTSINGEGTGNVIVVELTLNEICMIQKEQLVFVNCNVSVLHKRGDRVT